MFTEQHPTMNDYVGVGNNISLAVSSILKVKKAFWTQKKCMDDLTKKIKSLEEKAPTLLGVMMTNSKEML